MKKLAVFQIVLGALIVLIDTLAISGTFSSNQFVYFYPLGNKMPGIESGSPIQMLRPEVLKVACAATIVIVLLGLLVVITGVTQLFNTNRGKGTINDVMLGVLIVIIDVLALVATFLTPVVFGHNEPDALKVARWAMEAILPIGLLFIIASLVKLVNMRKSQRIKTKGLA